MIMAEMIKMTIIIMIIIMGYCIVDKPKHYLTEHPFMYYITASRYVKLKVA
jgi:hypothetical protein